MAYLCDEKKKCGPIDAHAMFNKEVGGTVFSILLENNIFD
jgi:hypothetical protein